MPAGDVTRPFDAIERPEGFTYAYPIQLRLRDFDSQRNVNNAVYFTLAESGRIAYLEHVLGSEARGWVLAEARCRYVHPVLMGERALTIFLRTERLGTSSLMVAFAMYSSSQERRVAEGDAVQVHVDRSARPTPIPAAWHERLTLFEREHGNPLPIAGDSASDSERGKRGPKSYR